MFFVVISYGAAYAENDEKTDRNSIDFFWSPGTKSVYSSGVSDSYMYNRSDVTCGFKSEYIDLSAGLRRYFNYQITDGYGAYEYHSFNEAGLSLELHLDIMNLSGDYSRADDFDDLKRDIYYGAIELDFTRVLFSAGYSYEDFEYKMSSNTIHSEKRNYSFTFEYNFTDYFSIDAACFRDNTYFNTLDYDYNKNIFRGGLTVIPSDHLLLITGGSAGKDSEGYNIYGVDLGATLLIYSCFKMYFIYSYNYYDPPQTESSGSSGGGSGHGYGGTNPYLSSDKIGNAYSSHLLSFGMSVTF